MRIARGEPGLIAPSTQGALPVKSKVLRGWADAGACVLITILILVMQQRSGAYQADLAFDPDEPAHAVTSLMVHDYIVQGWRGSPVSFAQSFYSHYPKVAIGHWPPIFFAAEAVWMLGAGRSRASLLLFVGLCAAALACTLYVLVRRRTSVAAGLISVAVLVHPRFFQEMLMTVHPEMLLALAVLGAAVFCGRWVAKDQGRNGVLFVVCALAALGVNGRGAIVLLLPFALLPLRRSAVHWRWVLAGALVFGVFFAAPYYARQTDPLNPMRAAQMAIIFLQQTVRTLDPATLSLAALGFMVAWRTVVDRVFWWTMASLLGCGFLLFILLPALWDDRYLLTVLPAAGALAALGADVGFLRLRRWRSSTEAVVASLAILAMCQTAWRMEKKPDHGYKAFVASGTFRNSEVTLADGDGISEGGMIVEGCLADPQRQLSVLRGSKLIAHATWTGKDYRLLYRSPAEVSGVLEKAKVRLVAIQVASVRDEANLLRRTMEEHPFEWERLTESAAPPGVAVYQHSPWP